MYSWGSDTTAWKSPGEYKYDSAKAPYLEDLAKEAKSIGADDRTYELPGQPDFDLVSPKKDVTTESEHPLILVVDGTGSMESWPGQIFDRQPLLYQTLSQYREDVEICHIVVGDAKSDDWPIQTAGFAKGVGLDANLKALAPEGGGGPGIRESYELVFHWIKNHVSAPNAKDPTLIIMGDEKFYDTIARSEVKTYIGDSPQADMDAATVLGEVAAQWDTYLFRKPYPGRDKEITSQWASVLGKQRIYQALSEERIVDQAMGVIAKKWGNVADLTANMSARQDDGVIDDVWESIRAAPGDGVGYGMKSYAKLSPGAKSIKLIEGG